MSKRVAKKITKYTERDFNALLSIYNFRCLSKEQLFELHYNKSWKDNVTSEYLRKKIIKMKKDGLIEEVKPVSKDIPKVYFLTQDGIRAIKIYFNFQNNIYDPEKRIIERGYYTYAEIRISNKFIAHQYMLNSFAIKAIELIEKFNIDYIYNDERHVSETYGIRPDGILSFEGVDLFLEMDMGTESVNQLKDKWNHYRSYLNSQSYADNKNKVIILFISNNKGRIDSRIDLIKSSIHDNFIDCLSEDIELYLGIQEKLISVIKNLIVPYNKLNTNDFLNELTNLLSSNGFKIASGKQMSKYLNDVEYTYYISNKIINKDYLVHEFFGEPMSGMNRMIYHKKINTYFKSKFNKDIPLLIVGSSEDLIIKNVNLFQLENDNNVYFTTIKRLKELPFNEAIFKIVNNDKLFCLTEDFLKTKPTKKL